MVKAKVQVKRQKCSQSQSPEHLIIYYYGDGKGKTTAALGAVLRAVGHGWSCLVLQAIKGPWPSGEVRTIKKHLASIPVKIVLHGRGFVGIRGDTLTKREHRQAAMQAITKAREGIGSGRYRLVVLDEFADLAALKLAAKEKIAALIDTARRQKVTIIITGHTYEPSLARQADIVTKMQKVKHGYDCGIMALKGIDF